jgi:hypothetical protein
MRQSLVLFLDELLYKACSALALPLSFTVRLAALIGPSLGRGNAPDSDLHS